jgi:Uma2 family endonuclease
MIQTKSEAVKFTVSDIEALASECNEKRYEIIDGELFVTRSPHWKHQDSSGNVYFALQGWSKIVGTGTACLTPGIVFSSVDSVIPDVIWISYKLLDILLDESGHLKGAPELIVEVLSPGTKNEERDKEAKLKLYSIRGVLEYWIVDYHLKKVEVYRREEAQLKLVTTLQDNDIITPPLLPGFSCQVEHFFR